MKHKILFTLCLGLFSVLSSTAQFIDGYSLSVVNYSEDKINLSGRFIKSGYKDKPEWIQYTMTGETNVFIQLKADRTSVTLQKQGQNLVFLMDFNTYELINASDNNRRSIIAYLGNPITGPPLPIKDEEYRINIRSSNKYVSLPKNNDQNGTFATQNNNDFNSEQFFKIRYAEYGNYYFLLNEGKKALDLPGSFDDQSKIRIWDFHGGPNQQFKLWPFDQNFYNIVTMYLKPLGVAGGSLNTMDGANIQQMQFTGTFEQHFQLTEKPGGGVYFKKDGN